MSDSPPKPGQAGTLEIEITPEMIEAGASELVFDSRLIREHVAEDVIRAALEAGGYALVETGQGVAV